MKEHQRDGTRISEDGKLKILVRSPSTRADIMAYPIIFEYGFKKSAQFEPKRTLEDDRFSIFGRQGNIWDENCQDLIRDNNEDFRG